MSAESLVYDRLSQYFDGDLITSSEIEEVLRAKKISKFGLICVKYKYKHRIISNVRFIGYCILYAIKSRISNSTYDLVVTYDPLKTGLVGLIAARIMRAKFAPEVNGVYTSPNEWIDEEKRLSTRLKKTFYPKIMRFVLRHSDGIKLLFDGQIEQFAEETSGISISSFPCYVDITKFTENNNINDDKTILFVGFPFKRKGVDILIKAFKKIASRFPDWKLKILGWFPEPDQLYKAISGHTQIFHHMPVPYKEMPEHIRACSILVLPSRSEAMGRVLVESMAAGKARIGSRVDGIPTVINDGEDGLLVKPADIDDLADKLELLMSDSALRNKLGSNGRKRALKDFTEDRFIQRQVEFYEKVLSNTK